MRYRLLWAATFLVVLVAFSCQSYAQDSAAPDTEETEATVASGGNWPTFPVDPDYYRGDGYYFSLTKIIFYCLFFFAWVKTTDWVNQDLQINMLKVHVWNPIMVGVFVVAFLVAWIVPIYALGFLLLLVAYAAPTFTYIFYYRNPRVEQHEKVLTPEHIRFWLAEKLKFVGIKIKAEKTEFDNVKGQVAVEMESLGGTKQDNQAATVAARQLPGFSATSLLLDDAHRRRATGVLLGFGAAVSVRYMIDGIWHKLPNQPIEAGQQVAAVLARLAHIDTESGQEAKRGQIAFKATDRKVRCALTRSVSEKGVVRWMINFDLDLNFETLEDLGMREKTAAQLIQQLEQPQGMVLFSALPAGGLTTMINTGLKQLDRFLRDYVCIEDENKPEPEIVNIDCKTYDSDAHETPATILPKVARSNPDAIVCRDFVDQESAKMLCDMATSYKMVIGSIVAKDSAEALLRILVMKVPIGSFSAAITAVVHCRLARKLCESCRVAYEPSAELLKKLGIPAGKVQELYRPPAAGTSCKKCDSIGYIGRTGIFELLVVDDPIRDILNSGKPQLDALRKAARASGLHTEMEHGILLVARGITSVEEIQRVLTS